LAQLGADLDAQTKMGLTPLWFTRDKLTLRLLLENGANAQAMNREGFTLLTRAVYHGHEESVEYLLSTGKVDPDASDEQGDFLTPLALAADLGHEGIVRRLLAKESVKLAAEEHLAKRAPLYYAVRRGHTTIARLIVEAGGGSGAKTKPEPGYPSPLMMAVEDANVEMVRLLIGQGAAHWSQFESGERRDLSYASEYGHEEVVKALLEVEHPGIHSQNNDFLGWTCLFYAVKSGHESVVQLLLEAASQTEIRIKDTHERTPLYYAAMYGFERIVRLLMSAGDNNVTSKDYFGHQPRWYAAKSGYPAVVELLDSVCQDTDALETHRSMFSHERSSAGNITGRFENQEENLLGPSSYLTDDFAPLEQKDPTGNLQNFMLIMFALFALFLFLFFFLKRS
jgi:ankyrin repeat protein